MTSKLVFFCSQLLIQSISAQCIGAIGAPMFTTPMTSPCTETWGTPCAAEWAYSPAATLAASNGPGVAVATASPRVPAGVSVLSKNVYEGALAVGGALPFLGTVAIDGALPTAGVGAVAYGCGSGAVGVTAENFGAVGYDAITTLIAAPYTTALGTMAAASLPITPMPMGRLATGELVNSWDANFAVSSLAASNGPAVAVSTVSPLVPAGVSVLSDNAYEGTLAAGGALPFLGTVTIEGALPTAGTGAVAYGCGKGAIGITAEDMDATGFPGTLGYGMSVTRPIGIAGPTCSFGYVY